jgi:hypothetical protein
MVRVTQSSFRGDLWFHNFFFGTSTTIMANTTTDVMVGSSPKAVTELYAPDAVENLDLNKAQASISTDLQDEKKDDEHSPWHVSSMSQKACRTQNPIRKIVDPIVKNIQSGTERGDGKDHISLAVSRYETWSILYDLFGNLTISFSLWWWWCNTAAG